MDEEAPIRDTVNDEASVADFKAKSMVLPEEIMAKKYPVKVSPAAVVSTTEVSTIG